MNLICFLNHGSPSLDESRRIVDDYVKGGVDIVETDFPADDPYLDGENIQIRMAEALRKCSDYDKYMENIEKILEEHPGIHLYILIYELTVMKIGIEKFIHFMKRNHLEDMILVGVEYPHVRDDLMAAGIKVSAYVEYHLPEHEIEIAKKTNGFIYLQATPAGKFHPNYKDLKSIIRYLREEVGLKNQINCGIGIHTLEKVAMVRDAGADGAFIGSQVMALHGDSEALQAKVREIRKVAHPEEN